MQHSGLGGGGFMLVRDLDGTYESIGASCVPLS
jgi:gamma-glutamyltranspeptidase